METKILRSYKTEAFPHVECFDDYHEIDNKVDELKDLYGRKIDGQELCCDGMYWGVFWIKGHKPKRSDVLMMLKKANVGLDDETLNEELNYRR